MYCPPMSGRMSIQMPSYEIRDFKVYFGNQYLPDARWSDFKDLGQGYGKDSNHVFFMGQIIDNVDPFSFHVIDDKYAEDYQHIFQYGRIIEGLRPHHSQPSTTCNSESMIMQPMNSTYTMQTDAQMCMPMSSVPTQMPSYEVRNFKVFFGSQFLPDARWIDFTILGQGYGKDVHHVFFMGRTVEGAHAFSFEVLKYGYAKDKNHVFHNGRIVEGLKPFGFQTP